eukprot:TRINITY_DN11075_c0_g2_i1.p1 TRINITY_DN11075_c0_g2~~TRINITY_DN11075_c0_g2_i1.p1  ORF type:complete len:234 (+),score=48.42 TRINITY_DN11075_c0_g2_i1:55-756(+)
MRKEYPGITDQQLMVKCEWLLDHYGKIRCKQTNRGDISPCRIFKARTIFDGHDLDRSGTISSREFGTALGELKHPNADDPSFVQAALRVVDTDNSGEIEWEEFLMFAAFEMGMSVPHRLLPEEMRVNQKTIITNYATFKDVVLNDASGSIWDSTDSMGKSIDPATAVQSPLPPDEQEAATPDFFGDIEGDGEADTDLQDVYRALVKRVQQQQETLYAIKNMILPPKNQLSKFM